MLVSFYNLEAIEFQVIPHVCPLCGVNVDLQSEQDCSLHMFLSKDVAFILNCRRWCTFIIIA